MLKRQRVLSYILCLSVTLMFSKCGFLMLRPYFTKTDHEKNAYKIIVSESRGNIYDRNGEKLVNDTEETTLLIKPTDESIRFLRENLKTADFLEIQESLLKGLPTGLKLNSPLSEHENIVQLKTYKRYSDSNLLRHIIGYVDINGNGVCGIEKSFENILNAANRKISAVFSVSAMNTVLVGENISIDTNDYYSKEGISLTIDKNIQMICEEAVDFFDIERGAAVVLDVSTSEILAIASRPDYDPMQVGKSLNNEQSPLINRALSAYSTGSVFKLVVSAAAIEKGFYGEYECVGKTEVGNITFNCHKEDGHGVLGLEEAISQSCNTYFISLAKAIGAESIIKTAEKLGFGKSTFLCEDIISDSGYLPDITEINSEGALANISFGQGSLTSTPLQIALLTSIIANNGNFINPTLLRGIVDNEGNSEKEVPEAPNKVLSEDVCDLLKESMKNAVESGTGKKAKPINTNAGVKTSTAENADGSYNSWVTGFFPADNPEYAIAIVKEDGVSGGEDCGPVFKRIAEKITLLSG